MNAGHYIGRLSKDFAVSSSGKMGTGTVAVDRPFPFNKGKDGGKITDFLTIKIIGEEKTKRAEQYLRKGVKIAFSGITCRDTFKDDQDNWKEFNYIMVTDWEFAESNGSGSEPGSYSQADEGGFVDANDDDLPFK